ncbi:hypothetical protein [Streptomyces sp. NPDC051561]|uniref:hypothetical protein n=1 Tax=Streptomyces sp. NPDC051561 TaxID=3365658 RepID=UPI0037873D50
MLGEKENDELRLAINRDLDCADVVAAARRILTRGTDADHVLLTVQLQASAIACELSYELCSQHARHHEHCRISAQATQRAMGACRELLQVLRP